MCFDDSLFSPEGPSEPALPCLLFSCCKEVLDKAGGKSFMFSLHLSLSPCPQGHSSQSGRMVQRSVSRFWQARKKHTILWLSSWLQLHSSIVLMAGWSTLRILWVWAVFPPLQPFPALLLLSPCTDRCPLGWSSRSSSSLAECVYVWAYLPVPSLRILAVLEKSGGAQGKLKLGLWTPSVSWCSFITPY